MEAVAILADSVVVVARWGDLRGLDYGLGLCLVDMSSGELAILILEGG